MADKDKDKKEETPIVEPVEEIEADSAYGMVKETTGGTVSETPTVIVDGSGVNRLP